MRYPAYLEIGPDGATRAFVFALPGVSVLARTADSALATLPHAIGEESARLAAAGRALPGGDDPAVDATEAERVTVATDVGGGATAALFRYELRPTRAEDVALALDRIALAHEEIARAGVPDERAAAALVALADGEWWLLSRLGNRPPSALPSVDAPVERAAAVHALVVERLTHLLPGDLERHAVFNAEQWTTRKVLRRLACLARDAAADVAAVRAPR